MNRRTFLHTFAMLAAALIVLVVSGLVHPRAASAQNASVQLTVIVASNAGSGVASSLAAHSERLRTQFARFDSFDEASAHRLPLVQGQPQSVTLPGGASVTITLLSVSGTQHEFRVDVPGGGTTVRSPAGSLFFVAGPAAPGGGTVILMIRT
jgi:hypothetical protein